jgi:hypothetical protein
MVPVFMGVGSQSVMFNKRSSLFIRSVSDIKHGKLEKYSFAFSINFGDHAKNYSK